MRSGIVQGAGPNLEEGRMWPAGRSLGTTDLNEKQLPNIGDFVVVKFEIKKPHSIFHY